MPYIEDSLGQGERIVAKARFHWSYSLKAWAALILLGWCLVGIVVFVVMMIRKRTTEIGVTSQRFVEKEGLFTLEAFELALPNIEGVTVTQSFLGRILGFGHMCIEGTGGDHIDLPNIADPLAFRAAIETAKSGMGR